MRKTAQKRDALAYAYFNYAAGQKKTAKEVSELTRAARKCGEAEGGGNSDSDSSRTSNSSPEKKRKARKCFGDRPRLR